MRYETRAIPSGNTMNYFAVCLDDQGKELNRVFAGSGEEGAKNLLTQYTKEEMFRIQRNRDSYQDRKELGTLTRDEQRDEWTNSMRERGFL